jgi:parallel beta-helix repeat protein
MRDMVDNHLFKPHQYYKVLIENYSLAFLCICFIVSFSLLSCNSVYLTAQYRPLNRNNGVSKVYLRKNIVKGINTLTQEMISEKNTVYIVKHDFVLGEDIIVPEGGVLQFEDGSINGNIFGITGQNTIINAAQKPIFNKIKICGTWNVTNIYSKWFKDYSTQDVIKNVFALQSDDIVNNIYLDETIVTVSLDSPVALNLTSNTNLYMKGTIKLVPTERGNYRILDIVNANNILIKGGTLIADYDSHLGKDGEYGHAIKVDGGNNIKIDGLTISKCWGDGISVDDDGLSKNVTITNCDIFMCRRNGITIGNCDGFIIENNIIYDIYGTEPQCCVQLENDGTVRKVINGKIFNNVFKNFKALSILTKNEHVIRSVKVANNTFLCKNRGVLIQGCDDIIITNNVFRHSSTQPGSMGYLIAAETSENIQILENTLFSSSSNTENGIYINTPSSIIKGNNGENLSCDIGASSISALVEQNLFSNCTFGSSGVLAKNNELGSLKIASGASIVNNTIKGNIDAGIGCEILGNSITIDVQSDVPPISLNRSCLFKGNNVTLHGRVNAVSFIFTKGSGVIVDNVFKDKYESGATAKLIQLAPGGEGRSNTIENNVAPTLAVDANAVKIFKHNHTPQ